MKIKEKKENLKFETKSARRQSSVLCLFLKMLGIPHGLDNNFTVQEGHIFAPWELTLGIISSEVIRQKFLWVQFMLLTEDASESCVRGPEQPALNIQTRIMAPYPSLHWAKLPPSFTYILLALQIGELKELMLYSILSL